MHHLRGGHRHGGHGRFPWVGILFVVMGGWWLLGEMGFVPFSWSYIGPIAILLVGLSMLLARGWGRHGGCWYCGRAEEAETGATPPTPPTEPGRQL